MVESEKKAESQTITLRDVFSNDYITQARMRAKRRKSAWNLLLIPAIVIPWCILWWLGFRAGNLLHLRIFPGQDIWQSQGLGTILVAVSPFFGALPLAMIAGNFLIWLLPPARRVLDHETQSVPSASYRNAQKQLFKIALVLVPVSLLLSVTGVLLPWHR